MRQVLRKARESADGRNFLIDVLRGFSIVVVMTLHGSITLPNFLVPYPRITNIVVNGSFGVDIFFVISGYLIASNTLKRNGTLSNVAIGPFLSMRIARIAPCLLLFCAVYVVLNRWGMKDFMPPDVNAMWLGIKSIFTLNFNYFYFTIGNIPGLYPMAPLWSIAVEESFYLMFPIVCFLCLRDRVITLAAIGLVLLGPFIRTTFTDTLTLPGVVDLLAMGCLTALVARSVEPRFRPYIASTLVVISAVSLAVTMSFMSSRTDYRWALTIVGMLTSLYILASRSAWCPRPVSVVLWPLAFLGRMSLQIYVFHDMIHSLGQSAALSLSTTFTILVATSWVLERSFLEPCNRFIRRLYVDARQFREYPDRAAVSSGS